MVVVSDKGVNQNQLSVLWIIWGAMVVTLSIYVLICHLVGDGIRQSVDPDFPLSPQAGRDREAFRSHANQGSDRTATLIF
jgi:hypothetical protein